jgi:hypothetical protein
MAIVERDKSIPVVKGKLWLCYDPLNIWFRVYTSRKTTSQKSKTGIVEGYEDLGYFENVLLTCGLTLKLEAKNKSLTGKMKTETQKIQSGIEVEYGKSNELIMLYANDNKKFKDAIKPYLSKKLKGKEQGYEYHINDKISITMTKEYVYFSYKYDIDITSAVAKNDFRWVDMGYYPLMGQAYQGLRKRLMLKAINEHTSKDIKDLIKLVNTTEIEIRKIIKDIDINLKKELKIK